MKKLFIILSLIAAIIALILSVLPLSNLAYIPAIFAFAFGILALAIKKDPTGKKTLNLAFLLTIIALGFTVYKSIFSITEVGNLEELEQKSEQSIEEAIETLENEINVIEEEPLLTTPENFEEKPKKDKPNNKNKKEEVKKVETPIEIPAPEEEEVELEDF